MTFLMDTASGGGAGWVLALSHFHVTVQMSTPRWVVGRVLSIYQTATFGGIARGSWIWGVVSDVHGADVALMASSLAMLAGGAIGIVLPLPHHMAPNLDPLDRWREPMLAWPSCSSTRCARRTCPGSSR